MSSNVNFVIDMIITHSLCMWRTMLKKNAFEGTKRKFVSLMNRQTQSKVRVKNNHRTVKKYSDFPDKTMDVMI